MKCLVLAAGMSTRLSAVTNGAPKPLAPVAGVPVLHRNLNWLARHGVTETYINLHHRPDEIEQSIGDGTAFGVHVRYSREGAILGTAGAAKKLEQELSSDIDGLFLVVYGDNVFGFDLTRMLNAHFRYASQNTQPVLARVAVFDPAASPHTGIAGGRVQFDAQGIVTGFVEGKPDAPGHVNAGVYICHKSIFPLIPPVPFASDWAREIFPAALKQNLQLRAHVINGYCLGIDTPESYQRALDMFASGAVQ
jgi:mannose-1-phosphate guanylyltransferase